MKTPLWFALVVVAAACGGRSSSPVGPDRPPVEEVPPGDTPEAKPKALELAQVDAETAVTLTWGATISVPAQWWIGQGADLAQLQDPERELTLTLTTVTGGDRDTAFAAAWQKIAPGFDLKVAQADDLPGTDGWDSMSQIAYVTPTAESRLVIAFGRKKGDTWHFALIDGKVAAIDRRGAQVQALIFDMKVPGVDEESWAGKTAQVDDAHLAAFDAYVEQARTETGVPGVAVAIVHGGKIVFEKGYGTRTLGKKAKPVKPGTAFMIGSTSKSLTTLLMARLIDQGKLTWETPVTQVLPWFALGDEAVTKQLTLQHTVCACTGMPRQDLEFLFEYAGWDAEKRLASMKTMKPTTGFGETFQYSNLLVATGGYVAAHQYAPKKKLGPAYDAAMQDLVFKPLGMKHTTLDFAKAEKGDWAHPHGRNLDFSWAESPVEYEKAVSALRPAGGVWSTAHDMAQFLMLELAKGKVKGKQVVSEENLLRRRTPQIKITEDLSYGLGLFVENDHGASVVHHGGNMLGFTSDLFMLPDSDVGVVILTNGGQANALRGALHRRFLEIVFDGKAEAERNLTEALARAKKDTADQLALLVAQPTAEWIASVVGTWKEPSLGSIVVSQGKDGGLVVDAGEWKSTATEEVDRDGTPKLITTGAPYVGFELVPGGTKDAPTLVLDAGQQVFTFVH